MMQSGTRRIAARMERNSMRLLGFGAMLAAACLPLLVFAAATAAAEAERPDRADELREAWIAHRLHGERGRALRLYEGIYAAQESTPDLRARSAIGLGLL
ncbi:MAG: hypothetical protein L0Z55_07735, partial [Planctomycetes bacterium]|nr:hypothetical protein [Planctomycetota bacterium]